jgi:SAM-dependent methyltransferase
MYAKGVNAPFLNIESKDPSTVASDYTGRFENKERDIARAETEIIEMLKLYGLHSGATVVDFGSGTGLFLQGLSRAVAPGGRVLATEKSAVFRNHLINRILPDDVMREAVKVIFNPDGRDPLLSPGYDGAVDLVFVCDVYHHLEYPLSVMRNLRKCLKPSGRLVLIDFHRDTAIHKSHPEDPEWILKHVRAGQEVFRQEILSCGFELVAEPPCPFLPENYVMVFQPVSAEVWARTVGTGWGTSKK